MERKNWGGGGRSGFFHQKMSWWRIAVREQKTPMNYGAVINVPSLGLRLKKKKNGSISAAGFQLPEHAATEDFYPWVAQDKG